MTNEHDDYDESFIARNRRTLGVVGVLAAVGLVVIGYNMSRPKPTASAGTGNGAVASGGTLNVGALPVT